jgi:hypothetical protein
VKKQKQVRPRKARKAKPHSARGKKALDLHSVLTQHADALLANTKATIANTNAIMQRPPCGTVSAGKTCSKPEIRRRVIQVAGIPRNAPDTFPFSQFPDASPDPYVFAQDCMNQSQFDSDGLALDRLYVEHNWTAKANLATIVDTIVSCYKFPR